MSFLLQAPKNHKKTLQQFFAKVGEFVVVPSLAVVKAWLCRRKEEDLLHLILQVVLPS